MLCSLALAAACVISKKGKISESMNVDLCFQKKFSFLPSLIRFCFGLSTTAFPLLSMGQTNYSTPYFFTTLAGVAGVEGGVTGLGNQAQFYYPAGGALDTVGNLYVADLQNDTIREVTPLGLVTTLAGLTNTPGTNDGTGSMARFAEPSGVVVDASNNIYIADTQNDTIRKMTRMGTNWMVTTVAGSPGVSGSLDGTNGAAQFNEPGGIALDGTGNLYVSDTENYTIRKITPQGSNWVVTTIAGVAGFYGSADGTDNAALFEYPFGIAADAAGNLYVADTANNTIRKMTPDGTNWIVTTLAGTAGGFGSTDGTNSNARFGNPFGVGVDNAGNVYVADSGNNTIRKATPSGTNWVVATLAGLPENYGTTDGSGSAARFDYPEGVVVDTNGNVYVVDTGNSTIRKGILASLLPPPVLQPPSYSNSQIGFGITGFPGLTVDIQSSSNFVQWTVAGTYLLNGGTNYFVGPATNQSAQFYRGLVP
jgi:ribosomal protein S11